MPETADPGHTAAPPAPKSHEAGAAEAMVTAARPREPETPKPSRPKERTPQSGLLTAGSWDDLLDPGPLHTFLRKQLSQNLGLGDLPSRFTGAPLLISVKGAQGGPVGNARVRVTQPRSQAALDLTTRSDGSAVLLPGWDRLGDGDLTVTVTPPGGGMPVTQTVPRTATRCEVVLPAATPLPRNLDLVIVLDTTGSMGDEIEYLKAEIKGIVGAVQDRFPHVHQRYALVLYRDEGDAYVTRTFDFTSSADEFRDRIAAQRAEGGGDYPEAMHKGLGEAVKLPYRAADTARVLFLIADAPPHNPDLRQTLEAGDALRKKGVAVYPVACSGYDATCEFVMRACALLTGGQFLFLTDDSGVGEAHGEPHIPYYRVQRLDQMMIRMIAGELSGRRLEAEPGEILRTVGRPPLQAAGRR
jgi:hypothetical protein